MKKDYCTQEQLTVLRGSSKLCIKNLSATTNRNYSTTSHFQHVINVIDKLTVNTHP